MGRRIFTDSTLNKCAAHHIKVFFQSTTDTQVSNFDTLQVCAQLGLQVVPEADLTVFYILQSYNHRTACNCNQEYKDQCSA